jgi:hypothetical protein
MLTTIMNSLGSEHKAYLDTERLALTRKGAFPNVALSRRRSGNSCWLAGGGRTSSPYCTCEETGSLGEPPLHSSAREGF